MENAVFHKLCGLEIEGGFLDGQKFDFSNGLNCLIGARGTGKTTVLEFIRYAMDEIPGDQAAQKRIASLIKQNLGGGHVKLNVETKNGLKYAITRAGEGSPIVLDSNGQPTDISLKDGGLFRVNIFSQNEIEAIADRALSQLYLIDHFEADELAEIEMLIESLKCDLQKNAGQLIPLTDKINKLKEESKTLPSIEEQLKAFGSEGGANAEIINTAHNQKAIRDREKRALNDEWKLLTDLEQQIKNLSAEADSRMQFIFSDEILSGINGEKLKAAKQSFSCCMDTVKEMLTNAAGRVASEKESLKVQGTELKGIHEQQELDFQNLMAQCKDAQDKALERGNLEKSRNDLINKGKEELELSRQLNLLAVERKKMLQKLSEQQDRRYQIRKKITDKINSDLHPTITVTVLQCHGREYYQERLEKFLQGYGIQQAVVARKLTNAFSPTELVGIIQSDTQKSLEALIETAGLNETQATKAIAALEGPEVLHELEVIELADIPKIELNDNGTYKETQTLSTGQKCTSILPILLLDSAAPLLIDQPEDNLDNRFVFETIVEKIRKIKQKRQLFFVTHNPNIPVLGDAEKVFVLESDGASARKIREGNVDDCKKSIITLLEGGDEAFKERQRRYYN
ncbi:MAG: AAA family ATPase [Candidatus Delongbacteria bacterium]|nr:AAA family ATPase [Candidatus Delongbacteria bacterium]